MYVLRNLMDICFRLLVQFIEFVIAPRYLGWFDLWILNFDPVVFSDRTTHCYNV